MEKAEGCTATVTGIEKVECYILNGRFYRTLEAAQNAKIVEEIVTQLLHDKLISPGAGGEFQVVRALAHVVNNYRLMPK